MASSEARFLQVTHAFVGDEPVGKLIGLQERAAFIEVDDGSVAIVIWPSLRGDELLAGINEVLERDRTTHLKLIIVGCDDQMRDLLRRVKKPMLSRRMIQTFHLRDDGEVWAGKDAWTRSPFGRRLVEVAKRSVPDDIIDRAELAVTLPPPMEPEERERVVEHHAFIDRFQAQKTRLTPALLVFIAVAYALQMAWGGSELIPTLVRMGANTDASLGAEPWRLLASASLHAGLLHVVLNGFVLFALGRFLEKVLGWARLAVLYVTAAGAGAFASAVAFPFSEASLSVGASGAIWGFLGAAAALAWRPGTVLPRNMVAPLRRTAIINLVINLSVSFLPQVDLWAHLGGGLAGAVLVATGILTNGLGQQQRPSRWRYAASTALAILAASLVLGIARGEPWRLVEPPRYQMYELDEFDVGVEVPILLDGPTRFDGDGQVDFVFGSVLEDPYAVVVSVLPHATLTDAEVEAARADFIDAGAQVPAGTQRRGERQLVDTARYPTFEDVFVAPNGLRITLRYALFPQGRVITEVVDWGAADPAYRDAATHVLESVGARG